MKVVRTISRLSLAIIVLTSLSGCYYDVEEELYPTVECMTENMSYSADIKPILNKDCYVCHSTSANFGNVRLEQFDDLQQWISNGKLQGSIKHDNGFSPMPKGRAKLLDCEIEKILAWIDQGAINN